MTTNPPTGEPEPRWEQPAFKPDPDPPFVPPVTGRVIVPGPSSRVPPPSSFETVISTLARLVWPVAILALVFTKLSFWPVLIGAIVIGTVLRAVRQHLRQRRRALPYSPPTTPAPGGPDFR